jgi:hypothetical protein
VPVSGSPRNQQANGIAYRGNGFDAFKYRPGDHTNRLHFEPLRSEPYARQNAFASSTSRRNSPQSEQAAWRAHGR